MMSVNERQDVRQIILNLHGIGTPQRALETGERHYWITEEFFRATVARVADLSAQVDVTFTFDDGNKSDFEIGAPVLMEHGYTASFFVLASRLNTDGSLSAKDMKHLLAMGHDIGSHGWGHVDWKTLDQDGQLREFKTAGRVISEAIGQPVTKAAIPFGSYNRQVLTELRRQSYTHVYSSDKGPWRAGMFPIPRTSLTADMALEDVDRILVGNVPLKARLRRRLAREIKKRI